MRALVIKNRFKELLAQKERDEGRRISYQEIREATGIDTSTLSRWATNRVTGADFSTIDGLCDYFDCELSDLLVRYDEKQLSRQESLAVAAVI